MRDYFTLHGLCKPIHISGILLDETPDTDEASFVDSLAVVLPEMTGEEEAAHFDDLIESWFDADAFCVFAHDEKIEGYESTNMGIKVTSWKEYK